ncbi:response regulator [Priestia koreensis]|uniref:response regulator n=1 Tax=Priestia koreensis TaxID=284581 RepID=UPI00345769BF
MRALIVDDEQHVREGIRLLGEWEQHQITQLLEAENGEEAIHLIELYKPEIIFTDMKMPQMDGISLLEWIKSNHPSSKTIVVTGYDDYHYMRKAIHFGSADYILKPVDPEILNHTISNAVAEWKKEQAERQRDNSSYQLINEMKPLYRDRKLTQLMNNQKVNQSTVEEFGFHLSQRYQVAIIRVDLHIIQVFQGDRDLAYFSILNVMNEILQKKQCGVAFRYLSNKGEIVLIMWDHLSEFIHILQTIHHTIKRTMEVTCLMAVGTVVDSPDKLMNSYEHAKQVMFSTNVFDRKAEKIYEENEKLAVGHVLHLVDYSTQIEDAIQFGDIQLFSTIIEQIMMTFREVNYLALGQLLHVEKEYQLMSFHAYKNYRTPFKLREQNEKVIELFYDDLGQFQIDRYIEQKKREIALFLKITKRETKKKNRDVIYEIEQFLQQNFVRDVKLQEISDRFYLSREYISRRFKQQFNENISDYLVKIRMQKAKHLLQNEQLKVYEVANMTGYQDDKYFRKVFKKIEGITPNEYRSSYLKSRSH